MWDIFHFNVRQSLQFMNDEIIPYLRESSEPSNLMHTQVLDL